VPVVNRAKETQQITHYRDQSDPGKILFKTRGAGSMVTCEACKSSQGSANSLKSKIK